MTTVREDIEDLFYGRRPVRRQNPKAGESEWFYMTPKNPDDLEEGYTYTDVPTQNTPNPLMQKSFVKQTATPMSVNTTTPLPPQPPAGNCQLSFSDMANADGTSGVYDDIDKLAKTMANMPSAFSKNLPSAANLAYRLVEPVGKAAEAASVSFTNGLSLGTFDEAVGGIGGVVGAVKAAINNQNPVTGFSQGYSAVRDDMRRMQQEAHHNYPKISKTMELFGGGMGSMAINPILSSAIAGIGYAEGMNDIGDKAASNVLGNRVANFVPTQVLPKPLNYLATEYISRYAPDWLKDFYQK